MLAYSWPGNVRQLKNITEQISIIETNRDITAEILRNYLPEQHVNSGLPALFGVKGNTGKDFKYIHGMLFFVIVRFCISCCLICFVMFLILRS